jgi:hypothetical protein
MKVRKRKTFDVKFTKFELVHLRDLFSITLPPELKQTISQALAVTEERSMVEARLWQTISAACRAAEVPLDDEAPDFICAASGPPPVGIFRLAQEPNEASDRTGETGNNPFTVAEEEEQDE